MLMRRGGSKPALPIRTVAMRDGLMMVGDHAMPAGRRHWRATASAFAIVDYHGTPLLWIEGDQVVGDMALTVAAPELVKGKPVVATPGENETLLWFEVVRIKGLPMIRTWWARGRNVDRTQRAARLELLDLKTWPERMRELLQLMNWVN
jgi:hypothetical protein